MIHVYGLGSVIWWGKKIRKFDIGITINIDEDDTDKSTSDTVKNNQIQDENKNDCFVYDHLLESEYHNYQNFNLYTIDEFEGIPLSKLICLTYFI